MSDKSKELLPCPFCGGTTIRDSAPCNDVDFEDTVLNAWHFVCKMCGANVSHADESIARQLWNTRHTPYNWLPISTAPKDGTLVLLHGNRCIGTGYYKKFPTNFPDALYYWSWGSCDEPTEWQPLPKPPTKSEGL